MGYFEGLTDANFKTDGEGRLLFYRWSGFFGIIWRGKGYVLPDEVKKQQIRRFIKLYYIVSLLAIIAGVVLVGVYSLFLLPLFYCWYYFATARLLKGLAVTDERMTLRESYHSAAESHNIVILWIMLILSIFFVMAGLVLTFYVKTVWLLVGIIFMGVTAIALGYMIKIRKTMQNGDVHKSRK